MSCEGFLTPEVLGHEFVKLLVGINKKEFTVHKKLLCDRCQYFRAAFTTGFLEAKENTMEMPEDDPAVVQILIDFLYRDTIPKMSKEGNQLRSLYSLAEKMCFTKLMDNVIDEIITGHELHTKYFNTLGCQIIYAHTHYNSKLRLYCCSRLAYFWSNKTVLDWSSEHADLMEACPELLVDVFNLLAKYGKQLRAKNWKLTNIEEFGPCAFHTHCPEESCSRKSTPKSDTQPTGGMW